MSGKTKRVLLLGATGTLGSYLALTLPIRYPTVVPRSTTLVGHRRINVLAAALDARHPKTLTQVMMEARPDLVVNCIGAVPNSPRQYDAIDYITINSLFPHYLSKAADQFGCYVIHISTDGVFSGKTGSYHEDDLPDAADLYGRSKLIGEICSGNCLTLRTTFFGVNPTRRGLVHWLIGERGNRVKGYKNYMSTGISLATLARTLFVLIERPSPLVGLYHLGGPKMSKFDLLWKLSDALDLQITVEPVEIPKIDRSLDSVAFRNITGLKLRSVEDMVQDVVWDVNALRQRPDAMHFSHVVDY